MSLLSKVGFVEVETTSLMISGRNVSVTPPSNTNREHSGLLVSVQQLAKKTVHHFGNFAAIREPYTFGILKWIRRYRIFECLEIYSRQTFNS